MVVHRKLYSKVIDTNLNIIWKWSTKSIVRLGQGQAKAQPKAITKFALNPPTTTQTFEAIPGKLLS